MLFCADKPITGRAGFPSATSGSAASGLLLLRLRRDCQPAKTISNLQELSYIRGMLSKYTGPRLRSPWRVLLGVLCISLVMVGGVVSATHTHSDGEVSHQDCGLCVTAHMAVQVAVSVTHVFVSEVFARVEASKPLASHDFTPQFALFSRPPPADLDRS